MKAHLAYLRYVLRHKWFVFKECYQLGIPWLGIIHDWSKFLPSEWSAYVHSFYNPDGSQRKYDPDRVSPEFDLAWLHHQRRNRHHWQYWMLVQDENEDKLLPMPNKYKREMLADWHGAGRAIKQIGPSHTRGWYMKNRDKIKLHQDTRLWIKEELGFFC